MSAAFEQPAFIGYMLGQVCWPRRYSFAFAGASPYSCDADGTATATNMARGLPHRLRLPDRQACSVCVLAAALAGEMICSGSPYSPPPVTAAH